MQRFYRLVLAAFLLTLPSGDAAAGVERGTLGDVSQAVVALYNRDDAEALHAMLAPDRRRPWPIEPFARRLADCRRRLGAIERISLPVMGTRTFGFIAAYFEATARDMFLEIDQDGFIEVLTFKGQDDVCVLSQP
jgi:hypothetical protein